jgi:hypothetical protein
MASVPQIANRKRSPRNKRRAELRAAKIRQTLPALPKPNRFPSRAFSEEADTGAARARGKYLDNLLREKLGLPLYEVKGTAPAGLKEPRSGGTNWDAKLTTKRRFEPRHEGPRSS